MFEEYTLICSAQQRIYLYPAPYVLHAKHFSIDDDVAVLMALGTEIVGRMRKVEDSYRSKSRELTLAEWQQRSWRSKYVDNVMRLTAALQ